MSEETNNQNSNRGASTFRMVLDLVMGSVYIVLAGVVFYLKKFGTLDLSGGALYAIAGLLIVYGAFRIYLGILKYRDRQQY